MENIEELRLFLVDELNFEEYNDRFIADNLVIYFREEFEEWRIMDSKKLRSMDLNSINFPIDNYEKSKIRRVCSENHSV